MRFSQRHMSLEERRCLANKKTYIHVLCMFDCNCNPWSPMPCIAMLDIWGTMWILLWSSWSLHMIHMILSYSITIMYDSNPVFSWAKSIKVPFWNIPISTPPPTSLWMVLERRGGGWKYGIFLEISYAPPPPLKFQMQSGPDNLIWYPQQKKTWCVLFRSPPAT